MLETPTPESIVRFAVNDHCNTLTVATLKALNLSQAQLSLEATVRSFPPGVTRALFLGQEDVRALVGNLKVEVVALPDGSVFAEREPVLRLSGMAEDLAVLRTSLTGAITFYSSLVTRMAEYAKVAKPVPVHFFGLRKIHPSHVYQYLLSAYVSGMEIDATELSRQIQPGIIAADCQEHFTNIVADAVEDSWSAFLDLPPELNALHAVLDNLSDPIEETRRIVRHCGAKVKGLLVDLDATRRGHLVRVVEELLWTLKLMERPDIKIFLTGGVTLDVIAQTKHLVSGYGVGVSSLQAPVLDFSFQVVEVNGRSHSKLGVLPGRKSAFVCALCEQRVIQLESAVPHCCNLPMLRQLNDPLVTGDIVLNREAARRRVQVAI
jgi:nicotinate phosphoribosyltransferase